MQLESLKIFCDVVRWASFSRGAAENGIAQSSASQAVHQLEVRLGVKLIDRSKRPLVLTPQGRVYYDGCKELVDRYLELENRVKVLEDQDTVVGTVGVAAIYSVGLYDMSQYVRIFEQRHPGASIRLECLHPSRVLERVSSGEVELGLLSFPRKWPELNVITWREEPMVVAVDPSHPFARRSSVSAAELDGEPFVAFDPDLSIRRAIDRFLRRSLVQVDIVLEFDNIENIKRAVEIPAGISVLPEPSMAQEVRAGTLVAIKIECEDPGDRLTRPLAIVHRRQTSLEPAASRFLELLMAEEVIDKRAAALERERATANASP
jgi:DNA-binding transcriptional LysR family regulator